MKFTGAVVVMEDAVAESLNVLFPGTGVLIEDAIVEFTPGRAVGVTVPRPMLEVAFSGHVEAAT